MCDFPTEPGWTASTNKTWVWTCSLSKFVRGGGIWFPMTTSWRLTWGLFFLPFYIIPFHSVSILLVSTYFISHPRFVIHSFVSDLLYFLSFSVVYVPWICSISFLYSPLYAAHGLANASFFFSTSEVGVCRGDDVFFFYTWLKFYPP